MPSTMDMYYPTATPELLTRPTQPRSPLVGDIIQNENTGTTYLIEHTERTRGTGSNAIGCDDEGRYYWVDERGRRFQRWKLECTRIGVGSDHPEISDVDIDWWFWTKPRRT